MKASTQYWKPGEARPAEVDSRGDHASGGGRISSKKSKGRPRRVKGKASNERNDVGERSTGNQRQSSSQRFDRRKERTGEGGTTGARSAEKPSSGPSQVLLAMKFMQRKAKTDESRRQQDAKRKSLEKEFSSSFTKRLKATEGGDENDRLVGRPDEQDPAFVLLGRRSFGGFNVIAETAYATCVRDIAAGAFIEEDDRDDENGISDMEMAKRLGRNSGCRR